MYTLLVWKLLELLHTPCWNQCLHPREVRSHVLGTNEQEWLFLHHHSLIWHPSLPVLVEVLLEGHLGNNKQHGNISCKAKYTTIKIYCQKNEVKKSQWKVVHNRMFAVVQLTKLHGVKMHKIITCLYNLGTSFFHMHDTKKIHSIYSAIVLLYVPPILDFIKCSSTASYRLSQIP